MNLPLQAMRKRERRELKNKTQKKSHNSHGSSAPTEEPVKNRSKRREKIIPVTKAAAEKKIKPTIIPVIEPIVIMPNTEKKPLISEREASCWLAFFCCDDEYN